MKHFKSFNQFINEKLELVSWNEYSILVEKAYSNAPKFDVSAVKHWESLNSSNHILFKRLLSKTDIIFTTGDIDKDNMELSINGKDYIVKHLQKGEPYADQKEMKLDWEKTGTLMISIDHSEHPVFSVGDNVVFRSVHDFIVHILGNHPFGERGEIASYNRHAKLVPPSALPALFTEVIGQACYCILNGGFPEQKITVLKGFDYINVGRVEGHIIRNKRLIPESELSERNKIK